MIPAVMFKQDRVQAVTGSQTLSRVTDYNRLSFRSVETAYVHNEYFYKNTNRDGNFKNNIAVAQLKEPFVLSELIQVIKLANFRTGPLCRKGIIIGGGLIDKAGKIEGSLKFAKVYARTIKEISRKPNIVSDTTFYTEIKWYRGYPLRGELGSPFICARRKEFIQYGIASSYYNNSGEETAITVYESVYKNLEFIKQYVNFNFFNEVMKRKRSAENGQTVFYSDFINFLILVCHLMYKL